MIVLVGLALVAILVIVALVVDHSLVRQDRQANKSATDFAAAAGIRSLDDGNGSVQPWKGVCAAIAYAKENANGALDAMTGTYTNGDESTTYASSPCDDPTAVPYTNLCTPAHSTWASFVGRVDGGRIRLTVKSGYVLPDPAFPEDANAAYASDTGDAALGGCDQLGVILEERQPAQFGGIVGSTGTTSRVRSVGRLEVGTIGESTAALLLLERSRCDVLRIEGTSGARVEIGGLADNPGVHPRRQPRQREWMPSAGCPERERLPGAGEPSRSSHRRAPSRDADGKRGQWHHQRLRLERAQQARARMMSPRRGQTRCAPKRPPRTAARPHPSPGSDPLPGS